MESAAGHGATFWFTARFQRRAGSARPDLAHLHGRLILIVDDDPVSVTIIQRYLQAWGMRSEAVRDSRAAVARLRSSAQEGRPFDVALIDFNLGGEHGIELGARVKADPVLHDTKLLLLTAFDEPRLGREALAHGFSAYIRKPLRQSALLDAIASAFGERVTAHVVEEPPHDASFWTSPRICGSCWPTTTWSTNGSR